MVPQEEQKKSSSGSEKKSIADTQEARILMYIVPVILVLAALAYFFRQ
jgi:hypothetical protein